MYIVLGIVAGVILLSWVLIPACIWADRIDRAVFGEDAPKEEKGNG